MLLIAGAPTEQETYKPKYTSLIANATQIVKTCNELNFPIAFVISAMRTKEFNDSIDTSNELRKISTHLEIININRIEGDNFKETDEWKNRILKIVDLVINNL